MPIRHAAPTRRHFTFGIFAAALGRAGATGGIYNPKLAIHTSLWLAEGAARKKRPAEIADEAFGVIQRAGYRRVQLVEEFTRPEIRERTLTRLERLGLEPSILSLSGPMHSAGAAASTRDQAVALARFFAGRAAFVEVTAAPKSGGSRKTDGELDAQAYQFHLLGLDLERAGAPLLIGHGAPEMAENAREWRHMVAHTEKGVVSMSLDVETAARSGVNPWALIDTAGGRLRSVLLRNTRQGNDLATLDEGDIDLEQIAKLLRGEQYDGFLVVDLRRPANEWQRRPPADALAWSRWRMQEVFGSRPGGFPVDMGPHVTFPKPPGK